MKNLNENAIREAAYYIWKNNGCPANTSQQDWNLAIQQLTAASNKSSSLLKNASSLLKTSSAKNSSSKTSASKIAAPKKTSAKTVAKVATKKTTAKKSK